ncbi:hypothetical protein A9502_31265, partial [Klebsiella pneumoniae]
PVDKAFPYRLTKLIECIHLYFHDVKKISRLMNCREQRVGMLHAQRLKPTIATLKYHPGRVRPRLPVDKAFPYRLTKLIECIHLYFHDVKKISRLMNC